MKLPVDTFTLANGLTVLVNPDGSSPMAAVSITYRVGSQDERPGRSGFAHLFEHLMAQGTKSLKPREISELVESNGGSRNAFTTRTNTTYHSLVPGGALELLLWAEAERMHTLDVDARALALEQQVVLEERRLRYENAPYRFAQDQRMAETAFTKWENRHTTIGETADIRDAKLDDVRAFYARHYSPGNAVLALAGDVTLARARELVERYFAPIPAKSVPPRPDLAEPPPRADAWTRVEDPNARTPRLMAGWHGPARGSRDFWALTVLAEILSGQDESPLYQELVRERRSALAASPSFPWWTSHEMRRDNPDLWGLMITPKGGSAPQPILAQAQAVLDRFAADGATEEELTRAKATLEAQWIRGLDFLLDRAQLLSVYAAMVGPIEGLWADFDALQAITSPDVAAAAGRWLSGRPRAVVEVVPGAPRPVAAAEPAAAIPEPSPRGPGEARPRTAPTRAPRQPDLRRFALSNGLAVAVVREPKLPQVQLRLTLNAGRVSERPDEDGFSLAAASLLSQGAEGRSAEQIAKRLGALGYSLSSSSSSEALNISAAGPSRRCGDFLRELGALLCSSTFPDDELALWKVKFAERLKGLRDNPDFMAGERLKSELFAGHPYGRPYPDERASAAVAREALKAFRARRAAPGGATLVAVGDVEPDAFEAELESALASWRGQAAAPELSAPAGAPARLALVDRPGSTQATIVIAQSLPVTARDPDYLALQAANQVLGGSATSRLFVNLRVDKGYTYGAYSSLDPRSAATLFTAQAETRNAVVAPALEEMRLEIARLREAPVGAAQLAEVKRLLAGRFMTRLTSTDRLAETLRLLLKQGRDPVVELREHLARLDALTAEDLQAAAARHLDAARMTTVVVGDAAVLAARLPGAAR